MASGGTKVHAPPGPVPGGKIAVPAKDAKSTGIGEHPVPPHPLGEVLIAADGRTESQVPHRMLLERDGKSPSMIGNIREMLIRHHVSPEALKRSQQHREALKRLGLSTDQMALRRFPTSDSTRKGNLAEIVLAEYIVAASHTSLPVYRLRYNPNVDQSMKGDDVLAFDLDADPVRIIVGESKFRETSTVAAVREIVAGLASSHSGGIPLSLQFVADRLFEEGNNKLGERILDCARLFGLGKLRLDYVGLLFSDTKSADRVHRATLPPPTLRRLAMISLGVKEPESLVSDCYSGLE